MLPKQNGRKEKEVLGEVFDDLETAGMTGVGLPRSTRSNEAFALKALA